MFLGKLRIRGVLGAQTFNTERAFDAKASEDKMREAVRLAVRRCATVWTGKKPLVEVMLMPVPVPVAFAVTAPSTKMLPVVVLIPKVPKE